MASASISDKVESKFSKNLCSVLSPYLVPSGLRGKPNCVTFLILDYTPNEAS